jgi:hypothetical protein
VLPCIWEEATFAAKVGAEIRTLGLKWAATFG